eukprot:10931779-Alexandrium_andersonii.AAC.1
MSRARRSAQRRYPPSSGGDALARHGPLQVRRRQQPGLCPRFSGLPLLGYADGPASAGVIPGASAGPG